MIRRDGHGGYRIGRYLSEAVQITQTVVQLECAVQHVTSG